MSNELTGKVVLVTGGSSGIGRSTACLFAEKGAKTVVAARRIQEGEETVNMIKEAGGEAIYFQTDVSMEADVECLIDRILETYGQLDYAFNNAGVTGVRDHASIIDYTEEEWDMIMNVNIKGVWLCVKHEITAILKQGGSIVNMSSIYGLKGNGVGGAYATSKHAVIGLTKSAALQYAAQGIRVNAICPAFIDTPLLAGITNDPDALKQTIAKHPINRLGTPEEIAEAVVWLSSDAASFVTGHALVADGGFLV